jgi:chaperonin GroES
MPTLKPLSDYVVATVEAAQTKTASGFYLPDSAQEKPKTAIVSAVGPDVKQLKVKDQIVYKSYSPTELKIGNVEYILVKEEDVLATVEGK